MPTKFLMSRDVAGYNGFGLPMTLDAVSGIMAAGVAQSVAVPDTYPNWIAIFTYTPGASVWVDTFTTAVAPTGAFSATTSELNPAARFVKSGDVLSLITSDITSPAVSILFYVAPPFGN
jgi:hypothetical protein